MGYHMSQQFARFFVFWKDVFSYQAWFEVCQLHQPSPLALRRGDWYLHQWTNISAGTDSAHWGKRNTAMEMFDLKWAFAIAPLYKCKVVVVRPKKKSMP